MRVHGMPRYLAILSSVLNRLFQDGETYLAELRCKRRKKRKKNKRSDAEKKIRA
jgi:predicted N-acyltransferase